MLKVYGIHGRTTALIRIPFGSTGKGYLECEFNRGRMGMGPANRPATYVTGDPVKQGIIENSPLYGGTIKLVRVYEEEKPAATAAKPVPTVQSPAPVKKTVPAAKKGAKKETPNEPIDLGVESYPEITTREDALAKLKELGALASDLIDDDAAKAFAEKNGIIFSNFSF